MPKIIRVRLTAEQRDDLNQRARARAWRWYACPTSARPFPRSPRHSSCTSRRCASTSQPWGRAGSPPCPTGPYPDAPRRSDDPTIRRADLDAVVQLLDAAAARGETWTTPRLRHWLATTRGVHISTGRLGVLVRRERLRWKRTKQSVRHMQQDPALQDAATAHLESLIL